MTGFGFGGMSGKGETSSELDVEHQAEFLSKVTDLFPENASSRLARACGGVANRTAQKWLSAQITPPADVLAYVWAQHAIFEKSTFYEDLKAFYLTNKGDLDDEVAMGQLARLYVDISGGYNIR